MSDEQFLKDLLLNLKKPMPYKWRVQSFSKQKPQATCVAYIDARDVMDRLDECCVYGWDRTHIETSGSVYCTISIYLPSGRVLSRSDCGTESQTEAEKGESSDSFKRAAVNFGVGRFLYDMKIQYVDANEVKTKDNYPYVIDERKQRVWDLTKYINDKLGNTAKKQPAAQSVKINAEQKLSLQKAIVLAGMVEEGFCKHARIVKLDDLEASRFDGAMEHLKSLAIQSGE